MKLPGANGSELIPLASPVPVIVTNFAGSMKAGAVDYLAKPCSYDDLLAVVAAALSNPDRSNPGHQATPGPERAFFQGECPMLKRLYLQTVKVARTDSTVLIQGETGTGKELTARRVHALSRRSSRPLRRSTARQFPNPLSNPSFLATKKALMSHKQSYGPDRSS